MKNVAEVEDSMWKDFYIEKKTRFLVFTRNGLSIRGGTYYELYTRKQGESTSFGMLNIFGTFVFLNAFLSNESTVRIKKTKYKVLPPNLAAIPHHEAVARVGRWPE